MQTTSENQTDDNIYVTQIESFEYLLGRNSDIVQSS